jgi:hypothetical protein
MTSLALQTIQYAPQQRPLFDVQSGFASGTVIDTDDGPVPIDWLRAGDRVRTLDHGYQEVIWAGKDLQDWRAAGAVSLCANSPSATQTLAGHRVLVTGWKVELFFGHGQMLVEAGDLSGSERFEPDHVACDGPVLHVMLEHHSLIRANGLWVESLCPDKALQPEIEDENDDRLARFFDALDPNLKAPRPCLRGFEAAAAGLSLQDLYAD